MCRDGDDRLRPMSACVRSCVLLVAVLLLPGRGVASAQEPTPHEAASGCRADPVRVTTPQCEEVCLGCHLTSDGAQDVYYVSDRSICEPCHEEKTGEEREANRLISVLEHGNHPVGVDYRRVSIRSELDPSPSGPKLFVEGETRAARMFCSTCHNPHSAEPRLLRVSPRDALCRACHVK